MSEILKPILLSVLNRQGAPCSDGGPSSGLELQPDIYQSLSGINSSGIADHEATHIFVINDELTSREKMRIADIAQRRGLFSIAEQPGTLSSEFKMSEQEIPENTLPGRRYVVETINSICHECQEYEDCDPSTYTESKSKFTTEGARVNSALCRLQNTFIPISDFIE